MLASWLQLATTQNPGSIVGHLHGLFDTCCTHTVQCVGSVNTVCVLGGGGGGSEVCVCVCVCVCGGGCGEVCVVPLFTSGNLCSSFVFTVYLLCLPLN